MNDLLTNCRIASRGLRIVNSNERYKDGSNTIGDVLVDIMHYADQYGKDFEKELHRAR